ncbi:DEAD/DEAH box helicase [Sanguibacter massiliensis]|uniref:DEAD/DEAH box helicase n=1 Tax=Sanguibacter massiliensis TaxID=1973217 RepID=UPI000C85B114
MARAGTGRSGHSRGGSGGSGGSGGQRRRARDEGLAGVLAGIAREIDAAVRKSPTRPAVRTKFQVVALLVREERARVQGDESLTAAKRTHELKRLDGVATSLAKIAARDTSLLTLLGEDARVSGAARTYRATVLRAAGVEVPDDVVEEVEPEPVVERTAPHRVVPRSAVSRRMANPFLAPDFEAAAERQAARPRRLAGWELLEPLFRSFEVAGTGEVACMPLPDGSIASAPPGRQLMHHQAQVVHAAARGHRTFLLADEPGLGKTAQALLAAQAGGAFPLLVVAPNVVKTNWAHEARLWVPHRRVTVIHGDGDGSGDGDQVDAFADVIIVNYEILDRHVDWLGDLGFRGMVVDEAHFIKNRSSQRSRNVLTLSKRIRERTAKPLLVALTGTPLINSVEDFRAIWQFLGWIDEKLPVGGLMTALEDTGLSPGEPGFYAAARRAVVDMGIVRRRKVEVVADFPARRVADLPVEIDGALGRSIRASEAALARRMVEHYRSALAHRSGDVVEGVDLALARRVAAAELKDSTSKAQGENIFTMVRRLGQAKAGLAADYTAQLARNVGKVVFFAKHVDVMDEAERVFADRGIGYVSIRGDQTARARAHAVKAFTEDDDVQVVVCSLMAAGVGLNLQVASNLVLAELPWTDAEQTQAIDRVHRIGQDEPVTAWRVVAAQTIDAKIAELIDAKSGLAARALDGADIDDEASSTDVQLEALVALLVEALGGAAS